MDPKTVLQQDCLHVRLWVEDGVYKAKWLDVPGCVMKGATKEEAIASINEAILTALEILGQDATAGPIQ